MSLDIQLDQKRNQFTAQVDGKECTLHFYPIHASLLDYYSTYVPPELRGRGYAGEIVEYALRHAKANGLKIIPSCSYVRAYIDRHPEWRDIVGS